MDVSLPQPPDDPLAPYDLSALCDGRRTDFPLGMLVETVKVMLNDAYLLEGQDFLLAHKNGQSKIELRRPPRAGDTLVVLRVPARATASARQPSAHHDDVPPYDHLPKQVKDNIAREQWPEALHEVVHSGTSIPESGRYVNLKNGLVFEYVVGQKANGPLLPVHALAGARGKEDRPFHHAHDAHYIPPSGRPV
jgi:hypothetical protein